MAYIKYIQDEDHYTIVIEKAASVKKSLWIGTADIKDLHVKAGNSSEPFLGVLAELLKRGVEVRLIHAKEPDQRAIASRFSHRTFRWSLGRIQMQGLLT